METAPKHKRYEIWLKQAEFDIQAAKLSKANGFYEWACFQSEQSLEKTLKAVIVHAGVRAPRIHKLGILMGMSNQINPDFFHIKIDFRRMESYTFVARYPFLIPGQNKSPHEFINEEDATECIFIAENAIKVISNFLHHNKRPGNAVDLTFGKYTVAEINGRVDRLITKLAANLDLKKVIVFGGFARNPEQPKDKTMDLLVIANTDLGFFERIKQVRQLASGENPIIEPLVYTEAEFKDLLHEEGEGFLESAVEEGKVVFEKKI